MKLGLRKILSGILAAIILVVIVSCLMLPEITAGIIRTKLKSDLATDDVQVNISAVPQDILWGHLDLIQAVAHQAKVGEVYISQIELDGREADIDIKTLLNGEGLKVTGAGSLTVKGYVSAENLRELISRKVDRLEDIAVTITPKEILVTAKAKVMGRQVTVELAGTVLEDRGGLYFQPTGLHLKNSLLGTAKLSGFMDEILLLGPDKLPLGANFQEVSMKEGKVVITAGR